ncbi:hypothetical protein B9G53_19400 [Pseudanabaena sp. SR411]|uniref:DUF928 domain-containing protein n=1 Tax=Pseudanabaena sp. SR411 TaxID=1980935 RepID=UPI000B988682|nr:DUF928 domain-containing protein [Pseudanabaena sp. SR411]OYQ62992.1 hypothetical protein B9G53_19400 [Pseudanabaena sp. SR411]
MGMILGALDLHVISIKVTFSRGDRIMVSPKFSPKNILIASACSCLAVSTVIALPLSLSFFTPSVQAQSRKVRYVPPSNLGTLTVSVPGATRSSGCTEKACLIGIVPDLVADNAPVPQTISDSPTFYFLVPEIDGRAYFYLYEVDSSSAKGKRVYRTSFKIKNKAGILAFKMGAVKGDSILELNKNYVWEFTVSSLTDAETVRGSIRRVSPSKNLADQLKKTFLPLDRAVLFAQEGIWFETVQTLAEAQKGLYKKPEIVSEWTDLLKSATLERVIPFTFLKSPVAIPEQTLEPTKPTQNNGY